MPTSEQFGMDPDIFAELDSIDNKVLGPVVVRHFSDGVFVARPDEITILPGETAAQAHIRLQNEKGTAK